MKVPFDHIAASYDSDFTNSIIGQLQRRHVWTFLEKTFPKLNGLEILELNCGTGEDALFFSERGFTVMATDVSAEMLRMTEEKVLRHSQQRTISSLQLDLNTFDENTFHKKFDLVFSNFGGLNCVNPESFKKIMEKIPSVLTPGGRFIAVIMPKFCLWETFYFLAKLKFKNAFRRLTNGPVVADLNGASVSTWYYTPAQLKRWSKGLHFESLQSVGIAIPPSYLEHFFRKRKNWLTRFDKIEKRINKLSYLSGFSDHYLIEFRLP